jgi:hypothetical protein
MEVLSHTSHKDIPLIIISIVHAAAISRCFREKTASPMRILRLFFVGLYLVFYLAFLILFDSHLREWDDKVPGRCYNTRLIGVPNALHPASDRAYLIVTGIYVYFAFFLAANVRSSVPVQLEEIVHGSKKHQNGGFGHEMALDDFTFGLFLRVFGWFLRWCLKKHQNGRFTLGWFLRGGFMTEGYLHTLTFFMENETRMITLITGLQFPVHLYMAIALRVSNNFDGGADGENAMGFGQILALMVVIANAMQYLAGLFGMSPLTPRGMLEALTQSEYKWPEKVQEQPPNTACTCSKSSVAGEELRNPNSPNGLLGGSSGTDEGIDVTRGGAHDGSPGVDHIC